MNSGDFIYIFRNVSPKISSILLKCVKFFFEIVNDFAFKDKKSIVDYYYLIFLSKS